MADSKNKVHVGEIGNSGTAITSGIIMGEEYNPDLIGLRGMKIWEEMRRGNATVRTVLQAINMPIIQADWYIEEGSDSARDKEIAAMVQENLIETIKLKRKLELILTMMPFGFSLFEMVFGPMIIDGKLRLGLKDLAFRKQTTVQAWQQSDGKPGVTQQTVNGVFDIPDTNLARFTYQQEGDNYEGVSILRSAYMHWYFVNKYYKMSAIGHERQSVGIPYAEYGPATTPDQKKEIELYLQSLRANEKAYLMFPQGTQVGFMDMKAGTTSNPMEDIQHHDRQISKNSFLQFMEIGASNGTGTRSTSEDHSRLFELSEEALADLIAETLNDTVVKALVDANFSDVAVYPKVRHGKLGDENIPVLSDAITKFVTAGALQPSAQDENIIRRIIGWPELSEEEIKEREELAEAARKQLEKANDTQDQEDDDDEEQATEQALKAARRLHASITKRAYGNTGSAA